jgi:uncharacterized RDD family membrane protein YckC
MMSQSLTEGVEPLTMDPNEIGWFIESADEEIYGPVSRKSLRQFLVDGTVTPNTLVRHCTQPEAKPVADQPEIMDQLDLDVSGTAVGDRLPDTWPRKTRDQLALAEDSLPCAWHKKPATLVCIRCHAPYCNGCRAKPFKKQFFFCKRCQASVYNRRLGAWMVDNFIYLFLFPTLIGAAVGAVLGVVGAGQAAPIAGGIVGIAGVIWFFIRDSLSKGASIGKRMTGLRVVQSRDGKTPPTHWQGIARYLSQMIPVFGLFDAMVPFRDPLMRRYGDRWAGTRVIDSEKKLWKARSKIFPKLFKKGIQPPREMGLTMEEFARIV